MAKKTNDKKETATEKLVLVAAQKALDLEKAADHHPSTMNPTESIAWKDRCDKLLDDLRKTVQPLSHAEFGFYVHILYDSKCFGNKEKLTIVREWIDAREPVPIVKKLLSALINKRKERRKQNA